MASLRGPVECRLRGQTAWVHILVTPLGGCDLGSFRASVPSSAKWGCEEHFHPHTPRQGSWVLWGQ